LAMTDKEKLLRNIETLRNSLNLDWADLGSKNLSGAERREIETHLDWCIEELRRLKNSMHQFPRSD